MKLLIEKKIIQSMINFNKEKINNVWESKSWQRTNR